MYMSKMISVGRASNGFVVECCVPFKPKEKKKGEEICCAYPGSREKQYVAKDAAEVAVLIGKLMPLLDEKYSDEKEFDSAFDEAAGEMEKEDKD